MENEKLRVVKVERLTDSAGVGDCYVLTFNDRDRRPATAVMHGTFANGCTLFMNMGQHPIDEERPRDVWFMVDPEGWVIRPTRPSIFRLPKFPKEPR